MLCAILSRFYSNYNFRFNEKKYLIKKIDSLSKMLTFLNIFIKGEMDLELFKTLVIQNNLVKI